MKNHEGVLAIVEELKKLYPKGLCSLQHPKPYELLSSVRLTAQCTDKWIDMITPALLTHFPTLESLAQTNPTEVKVYIHSTSFFWVKVRGIVAASRMLVEQYSGRVPDAMRELLKLPGVGCKTTNLILGDVYHTPGVAVVDTRCIHITSRPGLADGTKDPAKVEEQLRPILPPEESNDFCHWMVLHGRVVCTAREPDCLSCILRP